MERHINNTSYTFKEVRSFIQGSKTLEELGNTCSVLIQAGELFGRKQRDSRMLSNVVSNKRKELLKVP